MVTAGPAPLFASITVHNPLLGLLRGPRQVLGDLAGAAESTPGGASGAGKNDASADMGGRCLSDLH